MLELNRGCIREREQEVNQGNCNNNSCVFLSCGGSLVSRHAEYVFPFYPDDFSSDMLKKEPGQKATRITKQTMRRYHLPNQDLGPAIRGPYCLWSLVLLHVAHCFFDSKRLVGHQKIPTHDGRSATAVMPATSRWARRCSSAPDMARSHSIVGVFCIQ